MRMKYLQFSWGVVALVGSAILCGEFLNPLVWSCLSRLEGAGKNLPWQEWLGGNLGLWGGGGGDDADILDFGL